MRAILIGYLWLFTGWVVFGLSVQAEEAKSKPPTGSEERRTPSNSADESNEIHGLIKKLGSPIYRERQAAFLQIWKMANGGRNGPEERLIELATRSSDADVAASARWLQILLKLSASPGESSKLIEDLVLLKSGDTETIIRLARNHRWDHLQAMLEVLTPREREHFIDESEALSEIRARILKMAWDDHQERRIPALVDQLWSTGEAIDARRLWGMLGLKDWAEHPLPDNAEKRWRSEWKMVIEELEGQYQEAVKIARQYGQHDQATSILLAHGQWSEAILKPTNFPRVGSLTTGGAAAQAARQSLLASWSNQPELSNQWADAIGLPGPTEEDVQGVLLGLSLCGRTATALSVAEKRSLDEAFDYNVRLGHIEEAMRCYGIEQLDEIAVQAWLNKLTSQQPLDSLSDVEITQRMADVGCLLSRIGLKELGKIVDQTVIQWASSVAEDHRNRRTGRRTTIAEISCDRWKVAFKAWTTQHRRPFALMQFQQLLHEGIDEELRESVLRILYDDPEDRHQLHVLASPILLWFYEQHSKSWKQASNDLERMLMGIEPEDWPVHWHREGFPALGRSLLDQEAIESGDAELPIRLSRLALLHHRSDLAKEWLCCGAEPGFREWMDSLFVASITPWTSTLSHDWKPPTSQDRLSILGEMFFRQHDYPQANTVYEQLYNLAPERLDYALRRVACLRAIGEIELANQLRIQALSIPVPLAEIRGIANELESDKIYPDAILLLKNSLRSSSSRRFDHWILSLQLTYQQHAFRTANASTSDPSESISKPFVESMIYEERRQLLNRIACFPEMPFKLRYVLPTLEMLHRDTARLAILEGDFEAADHAIRNCYAIHPDQIETPIELVPLAKEAFGMSKVDHWVELYADPLESHLKKWPDDTLVGNNLAWLYANVERRLDRALELSRHVAELLPEDSVYLDTLAEVEFRLGNTPAAIELSSRCRQLTPLEAHHSNQLQRFLNAHRVEKNK